jgi:O-methyltransferase
MTTPERIQALIASVRYVVANNIPGSFVECGVWRGGSMMAAALTLHSLGDLSRDMYLFDVFDSELPAPTEVDQTGSGDRPQAGPSPRRYWSYVTVEEVRSNLATTGYPSERVHLVRGKVEQTIPDKAPSAIALLRLDTDWYESTAHELRHLYTRLSPLGVLIVDDYGSHFGARKAVDEFFASHPFRPLLQRIDVSGVVAVKPVPQ